MGGPLKAVILLLVRDGSTACFSAPRTPLLSAIPTLTSVLSQTPPREKPKGTLRGASQAGKMNIFVVVAHFVCVNSICSNRTQQSLSL